MHGLLVHAQASWEGALLAADGLMNACGRPPLRMNAADECCGRPPLRIKCVRMNADECMRIADECMRKASAADVRGRSRPRPSSLLVT